MWHPLCCEQSGTGTQGPAPLLSLTLPSLHSSQLSSRVTGPWGIHADWTVELCCASPSMGQAQQAYLLHAAQCFGALQRVWDHSGMLKEQKDSFWMAWLREGTCSKSGRPAGAPEVQASGSRGTGAAEQVSRETDHSSREWGYSQPQGTMGYSQT